MKVKRVWDNFYSALGKNIPYSRTFLFALLFVLLLAAAYTTYGSKCENRIRGTRGILSVTRKGVKIFYDMNGRYPDSIDEYRKWSGGGVLDKMIVDLTSEKQSYVPEYRQLNNKGGYYYDPNTGEIRLNLTRPVKEYLMWYSGRYKDQVPSSW
jgi:hypothetical protein